jgi:Mlc titration factor MtfA (ptsG expression regulator)
VTRGCQRGAHRSGVQEAGDHVWPDVTRTFVAVARRRSLVQGWQQIAERRVSYWKLLSVAEQQRLGELADSLVSAVRWEAARGFELTDEIVVTIAVQACVLILGLDSDYFAKVRTIIVHPTQFAIPGPRPSSISGALTDGSPPLHGEAHHDRGPVLIAWDQARFGARHRGRRGNVVLHEFAHKIDMLDGVVDGTPPLPDQAALDRWIRICAAEMERVRAGVEPQLLDDYAGQDPGEFFAVVTEAFFDRPLELRDAKPDLYAVFADFYRQDTAGRDEARAAELSP